ncbi:hypothetical protein [Arthrobacter sp. 2MCAF14]|uniref:hypothetical protein n=1 Tax=Arthrobacter sp. 2MCAF14 TaxID=3232982 RepID=UPI003F905853
MSTHPAVQRALAQVLKGEVLSLPVLMSIDHVALREAAASFGGALVISPGAVVSVLRGLDQGVYPNDLVQSWASFVRRGYIANQKGGPIQPLNIDYEEVWENPIVEAVSRLDEIGDIIDGEISSDEVRDLIQLLGSPEPHCPPRSIRPS